MASKGVEIVPAIDESNDNSLIGVVNWKYILEEKLNKRSVMFCLEADDYRV
jgi:hypothetical protein